MTKKEEKGINHADKIEAQRRSIASGLAFVPLVNKDNEEYLLLLPQLLVKQACDAARFQQRVTITRYCIFPLTIENEERQQENLRLSLLEVHENGLVVDRTHQNAPNTQQWETLSLAQFFEKEVKEMKTPRKQERHNLRAVVDAVSPIIAMDPKDPFAL